MMDNTDEADDVKDWLKRTFPSEFGGDKTQVIHTDKSGEVSKKELDKVREAVRSVDSPDSPINAIVSVLNAPRGLGRSKRHRSCRFVPPHHWDAQDMTHKMDHLFGSGETAEIAVDDDAVEAVVYKSEQIAESRVKSPGKISLHSGGDH